MNKRLLLIIIFSLMTAESADAYIGPGAGFAFVSSFFILFVTFFLAIITLLFMPFRLIIKSFKRKRLLSDSGVDRVIIIGLDGMDPVLTRKYLSEGKLPNLMELKKEGVFTELGTTLPAMSPVAWSTFATGVDPSRHNIFDFLNRDLNTYLPELSSTKIEQSARVIRLGKYNIPLGSPRVKLLRKSQPFWKILGEHGIFSAILRVPITFPPEKFKGLLLSGMCVPDLKGTQGTFTHYVSNAETGKNQTGGVTIPVSIENNKIKTYVAGPKNHMVNSHDDMKISIEITLKKSKEVELSILKDKYIIREGVYSEWIPFIFKPGLNIKVRGIGRFFIKQIRPSFQMYLTPINIDPGFPALPVSYPVSYSIYLSKMIGDYATLGLAEDTWALNERVIDEDTFMEQVYLNHQEREQMFFNSLEKIKNGLSVCVFDATDRVQHMFMRFIKDNHPAVNDQDDKERYKNVIEDIYVKMDKMVGRVMKKMNNKDALIVMSDHGFKSFHRGVNLNRWLYENGYLFLKDGKKTGREWFQDMDWKRTRAYTFGLSGLYINEKGRESKGIVDKKEKEALKAEIMEKLTGLKDEEKGDTAIYNVYNSTTYFSGPYKENGPDIIVGYSEGYRASWGAAVGKVEKNTFEDNKKSWSGDHCMDSRFVPGIIFSNKKIRPGNPNIIDIAPTVLQLFGVKKPSYMRGSSLID